MATEEYIAALQRIIAEIHGCPSEYMETVHVREVIVDKAAWEGDVEVFTLFHHPRAHRCFAWMCDPGSKGEHVRFYAVLESTMVRSPLDAVKFVRVADSAELVNEFSRLRAHF